MRKDCGWIYFDPVKDEIFITQSWFEYYMMPCYVAFVGEL